MKKTILSLFGTALMASTGTAQVDQKVYEGSNQYGTMKISYDNTVADKMYGSTLGNHLFTSADNGASWDLVFTHMDPEAWINNVKTYGNDHLSFFVSNSATAANNTVYLFDKTTNQISKQYTPPATPGADREWVEAYDIYAGDSDTILVQQGYKIGQDVYSIVYYSIDGGNNWQEIYHNTDASNFNIAMTNVAISPADGQKLFLLRGAGNMGVEGGLLVSSDGGTSWTEHNAGYTFKSISFDPTNSDIIYTGTDAYALTENLYKSTDGGDSWNTVSISWDSNPINHIGHIVFDPSNSNTIVVLEGNEIAFSTDGGVNWTNTVYSGSPLDLYYAGSNATFNASGSGEVAVVTDFYPVLTSDMGATVTQIENPYFNSLYVANSVDENHLYYMVQYGIVHVDKATGIQTPRDIQPIDNFGVGSRRYIADQNELGRIYFINAGFSGNEIYVLDNHAATITGQILGGTFSNILSIQSDPHNTDSVWVSLSDGSTRIIPISNPFAPINLMIPGIGGHWYTWFDPADPNHVIIGKGGEVLETFDYGNIWNSISNGITLDPVSDAIFMIAQNPNSASEFVIGTTDGLFKTDDSGANWTTSMANKRVSRVEYSDIDANVIAAAQYSSQYTEVELFITNNNGDSWVTLPNTLFDNVQVISMDFSFDNDIVNVVMGTDDLGPVEYEISLVEVYLGTEEETESGKVLVYPNPATDYIQILTKNNVPVDHVEIYSLNGSQVMDSGTNKTLNISKLNSGVYIMKIVDQNGKNYIQKLVKE